jgi:hypothetical protein
LQQFLLCRTDPARPSAVYRAVCGQHTARYWKRAANWSGGALKRAYSAQTENIQYQFSHPNINFIIHICISSHLDSILDRVSRPGSPGQVLNKWWNLHGQMFFIIK